ncbi:MAG TPA: hypothetical protein VK427_01170 [Kofleriaceae bacterium]|nr:hypothetical protein [Kofleriaceae bacterium]
MKFLVRSLFLTAALVGTASAQAPTPAPKKAPTTEKAPVETKKAELPAKDTEEFLAFFNKFVDTVVAAKEDCAKMTKDVNALIDANQPMIKKIQEAKAANKDLPQTAKDKMMSRVKEMMPAMNKCGADPNFQAAMKRMEGGKAAAPAKTDAPAKTETKTPAKPATK